MDTRTALKTTAAFAACFTIGVFVLQGASGAGFFPSISGGQLTFKQDVSFENDLKTGWVAGNRMVDERAVRAFYEARHNEPYWMSDSGLYSRAEDFVHALEDAWTHGLNPGHYHLQAIRSFMEGGKKYKAGQVELLLTDAFVRYARDLSGMRVDPGGLKVDPLSWQRMMKAEEALLYLINDTDMRNILKQVEPQGSTYKRLQKELVRLVSEGKGEYADMKPIEFEGLLRPGERHKRVPDIRLRLGVEAMTKDGLLYDERLAAAVIKFQREHGLSDDGLIGGQTLQILNRTNARRMEQIIVNLERLRWVEEERPDRYVVVNIPAATLWAIDGGRVDFEMSVIVGKPWRPTRSFVAQIEGVRFNPDWTVPPSIKRYDVLPKIKEDVGYLNQKGIQLISGYGSQAQSVDPLAVDWDTISARELSKLRMVQGPGENNPLGRVRILMPNKYNIYLHDTNHPEYFEKPSRALSSGCIRMKEPEKMAAFVMKKEKDWQNSEMDKLFEDGEKTDLPIAHKMPVYVLYYTAWTDSRGRVVYGTDIYNQDEKLLEKLTKLDGFYIPRHNVAVMTNEFQSDQSRTFNR